MTKVPTGILMADFFGLNEVRRVLQGFNPWWTGRAATSPPFGRLALGVCRKYLTDSSLRRAILLSGPRRVGKTTIVIQLAD